tara:strand:+ start:9606 stop:10142 length:537 start_codon:yes stop_codon:yes gene_type:complete
MSSNKRNITPPRTPPRQIGITTPTSSTPNNDYFPRNNQHGLNIGPIRIQIPGVIIPPPPSSPTNGYNNENELSSILNRLDSQNNSQNKKKKQKKGGMESLINSMNNMAFNEDPNKPRIGIVASKNIDLLNTGRRDESNKKAKKSEKKTAEKKGKQHAGKSKTRTKKSKTKRKSYRKKV